MKRLIIFPTLFALLSSASSQDTLVVNKAQQRYFDINKNIELFSNILRETDMFYVDSLEVDKTIRGGIDYMLKSLDPYTEYYNEEDMKDFTFMTTGEYAGVGASILFRDSVVVITEPFEGKPADKAGLKAGDAILSIDGKDMTNCEKKEGEVYGRTLSNHVSNSLKGQPGTTIVVKVRRIGEKKPLEFKVVREQIVVDPVTYYGVVDNNVGYICLSSFTDKSAMDVRNAFTDLKKRGIQSLVLDLRQNGGGILEDAVQIVNMFVPKGKTVLSTKGKLKMSERTYKTTVEPIDTDIPIVVLVNKGSASASEIVAGSLQDMDRAVLIGQRTFGKGLVQSTRQLPYGGSLKLTTAKYYIPSGRCVQAIDYTHNSEDGGAVHIADSLTSVFYTAAGRLVRDGGGVSPDIMVDEDKVVTISYYLDNQQIIFDWVTNWVTRHKKIDAPEVFSISDADYEDFKLYVKTKDFQYDRMSEKSMASLKEMMEFEGYMKTAGEEFKALESKLVPDLDRDLDTFKDDIKKNINLEIIKRYYYEKGQYESALKSDKNLKKAIEILTDTDQYKKILSAPAKGESKVAVE